MTTTISSHSVTLTNFVDQVNTLEGVRIDILMFGEEPGPKPRRVHPYMYDRKLPANASMRQLMIRIRTCLASNGDILKPGAVTQLHEGLQLDEVMIKGKHQGRVTVYRNTKVTYTRAALADLLMGDARRWNQPQAKGKPKDTTEVKEFTGFQNLGVLPLHTDKQAHDMAAGAQMEAMRGMLAQFIHTPRSGQRKADCLPTEPVAALEFLLKHYLATGAGSLSRDNKPPKEVVKGIDKLYAEAFPHGEPEHMDDHIPEDYLLLFWNINKYRFGVGHPLTIYKKPKS